MNRLIALRMDETSIQDLRQVVAVRGLDGQRLTNVSALIREAIAEFLQRNRVEDRMKR